MSKANSPALAGVQVPSCQCGEESWTLDGTESARYPVALLGRQLEDYATAQAAASPQVTAIGGGAVKVARRVPDHAGGGLISVRAPREAVEHGLLARGAQLEYDPTSVLTIAEVAACGSRAVEVARRIPDQARQWKTSVRTPGEAIEHGLLAGWAQLEHNPASDATIAEVAAKPGGAV